MKNFFVLFVTLVTLSAHAAHDPYYPEAAYPSLNGRALKNASLKAMLFKIMTTVHQRNGRGKADTLGCDINKNGLCYTQKSLDYAAARKVLFGKLHLDRDSKGYYIYDVYCAREYRSSKVGPNRIPDHNELNCEHTWPQSKFSPRFPKEVQKTDLHHLFPTDSKANGIRGNHTFGVAPSQVKGCGASRNAANGSFEPPAEHKGNVARALFYFSTRYQIKIDRRQEQILKRWHRMDPVDGPERERHELIFKIQKIRNPFIDYPRLVNKIADF